MIGPTDVTAENGMVRPGSVLLRLLDEATAAKGDCMPVNFPNPSRSYDTARKGVRFWGYDRSMEASFLVTADALQRIVPGVRSDAADLLRAFDSNRDRIHAIAAKVYSRGRRGCYDLIAADV